MHKPIMPTRTNNKELKRRLVVYTVSAKRKMEHPCKGQNMVRHAVQSAKGNAVQIQCNNHAEIKANAT